MPRKLSAIEIAEGALLADIAVIFQLLSLYLPIGKSFLRILIPIVITIIVLRRRLYVGMMGLRVALFLVRDVDLAAFDACLAAGKEPVPPVAQRGHGHPILSRSTLEVRASQQFQNHCCLAP